MSETITTPTPSIAERPWKKVGIPVSGQLTVAESLKVTGLDRKVCKVTQMTAPSMVKNPDGTINHEKSENADLFGISNPEKVMSIDEAARRYLGTVGRTYQVVQDVDALSFFDAALGQGAACVSAVGRLGRYGARTFVVASVPEMLEIVPGDPVERHIMLTTTHDGSGPIEAIFVNFRLASGSVLYTPVDGHQGRVRIKHTKNAESRVKVAHKVLHSNQEYWDRAIRAYRYLAKKDANEQRVREFLAAMFPDIDDEAAPKEGEDKTAPRTSAQADRSREEIRNLFENASGSSVAGKTDWGLFNAVAFFVDHERKLSKTQQKHGISRWEVSLFGPGMNLRQRAFSWLTSH